MENITCKLNGIKYLLVKYPVFKSSSKRTEELIRKHECVLQGVDSIKIGGLFPSTYMILNILVPEKNVIAFSLDDSGE